MQARCIETNFGIKNSPRVQLKPMKYFYQIQCLKPYQNCEYPPAPPHTARNKSGLISNAYLIFNVMCKLIATRLFLNFQRQ